ncbi:MAG TPA: ABC transporter permease [Planctomycetota bacterium]|nr:ABC transporter permease [Planctomycetota bacterium]
MNDLVRATLVECQKLRRTLALRAALLLPLGGVAMTTVVNLTRATRSDFVLDHPNGWETLMLDLTLTLWCFVVLPLFVSLETALLAGIEHRENNWKHLFALPVPRWTIYTAKLLVAFGLVGLTSLELAVGIGLEGMMILKARPDLGLAYPIPWGLIWWRTFSTLPAALLMVAVQTWLAVRWRSFTVPMGVGIGCTAVTIMLLRTLKNAASTPIGPMLASFFPWSLPYVVISPAATAGLRQTAFLVGVLGGLLVSVIGCWDATRRDVT